MSSQFRLNEKPDSRLRMGLPAVLLAGLGTVLGSGPVRGGPPPPPRRPNLVIFLADQMRGEAMGCDGNPDVKTPRLDRLAAGGVRFRNGFANNPVCCPARASILTGMYAQRHGLMINDLRLRESHTTIAEVLQAQGYRTAFLGKWHLDGGIREPGYVPPGPRRQGFEFWAAHECNHRHFKSHYFRDGPEPVPFERFEVEEWVDRGLEFVGTGADRPFFLMIACGPPHSPYQAPPADRALYDPARLRVSPSWREGVRGGSREDLAQSYGMITAMDRGIGRLLDGLEARGLTRDTIFLFTSDHGDLLGTHGLRMKRMPYEESARIPMILSSFDSSAPRDAQQGLAPGKPAGIPSGRVSDVFITHVDLMPTLLGLMGIPSPWGVQGADLSKVVRGETSDGPDSVFLQNFMIGKGDADPIPGWRAVRTASHLYARTKEGPGHLYDLAKDPYELDNLAGTPGSAKVQAELDARLARWMRETGDDWSLNPDRPYLPMKTRAVYHWSELTPEEREGILEK